MIKRIKINIPDTGDRNSIEIPTDSDTSLNVMICPTTTTDAYGERMSDYVVGLSLYQNTGAEGDGLMFTSLTSRQARNLIEQLSALIPKVEQLNEIVNG